MLVAAGGMGVSPVGGPSVVGETNPRVSVTEHRSQVLTLFLYVFSRVLGAVRALSTLLLLLINGQNDFDVRRGETSEIIEKFKAFMENEPDRYALTGAALRDLGAILGKNEWTSGTDKWILDKWILEMEGIIGEHDFNFCERLFPKSSSSLK